MKDLRQIIFVGRGVERIPFRSNRGDVIFKTETVGLTTLRAGHGARG